MDKEYVKKVMAAFEKAYGDTEHVRVFFAPGRVNLIGEHTDYNGGHVFPCALTIGTYAAVRLRDDGTCRFYSANFEDAGIIERNVDETVKDDVKGFTNYPLGVVWAMKQKGCTIDRGFEVAYLGNIPNSSGLSSSASVEVVTGYFLKELFGLSITNTEIALVGQRAENDFIGVSCGIMDQFIIAMGKKDHATYLNTATLEFDYVPVRLTGARVVIACSNKKRGLADSKYNERRAECEEAVRDINEAAENGTASALRQPVAFLGELSAEQFESVKWCIKRDVCRRRARHAVYENLRTIAAKEALMNNDIPTFGRLMNESHVSLADDYEVTGRELDTLVETAWKQEGVIGSRMTGAGFGGCTVSIVREECVDSFIENVGTVYEKEIGYAADFYVVDIGDGPSEFTEEETGE